MAQSCHIYLGIFGGRYGFIDPELNISVTEMEYNEARKDDPKKILIYIKRKQKYDSKQKKFLKRIQDFNKGYFRHEYFSTTKDLNKQIRKDLVNWIAGRINGYSQMKKDLDSMKSKDKAITTHYQQLAKVHNLSKDILL